MNPVVVIAIKHLEEKYRAETILLYGSFDTETAHDQSDIDVVVFADIETEVHDSTKLSGHPLDAWVYPIAKAEETAPFIHIFPFTVLKDSLSVAEDLKVRIEESRREAAQPLTENESRQLTEWIDKMLNRSRSDSTDANYRYNWLLNDFPELYCKLLAKYYDGPIKTLKRLKAEAPGIHKKYEELLRSGKNLGLLKEIYGQLVSIHLTKSST